MKTKVLKKTVSVKAKAIRDIRTAIKNRNKGIVYTSNNFATFAKINADKFMRATETFAKSVAPSMNQMDRRWMIGNLCLSIITKEFSDDLTAPDGSQKGFDVLYHNGVKISVKSGNLMFQKVRADGSGLTNPPNIILKNGLGNRDIVNPVFDYLLTIQRHYNFKANRYECGYGVVSKKVVLEHSSPSKKGDQVISNIPNEAYDYFSGIHYIYSEYKGEEKDAVVNAGEALINTALASVG